MDPVIAVAIFSFLGVVVTATAGVIVAIFTNTKERKQASESTMEKALRERLVLRDEQLEDLREELIEEKARHQKDLMKAEARYHQLEAVIAELRNRKVIRDES